ncbi:MAG: histidine phosphatase family protein, partial [Reyranella sp.]|nr:histidine phosphatase family protein [Reyranella sp.]
LRHVPTRWNAAGRLQGLTDTGLSPEGEAAARQWRLPPPAAHWKRLSSPLQRARRTAELVQPSAPVAIDSRLREMSFGVWEGFTVEQLRATGGEVFAAAEAAGLDFHPPGGESPRLAMARLSHWSSTLTEPVVAVSHKAAIRALLAWATGWNMLGRPPHKLDWTCLHFFVAHGDGRVMIERLNVPLTS